MDSVDSEQADLSLRWAHISEGTFSNGEARMSFVDLAFKAQLFKGNEVVS